MDATSLFEGMKIFIKRYFPEFKLKKENEEFIFYYRFEQKNLTIQIQTSILDNSLLPKQFKLEKGIRFVVLRGDRACLELRKSRIMIGWEKVAKKKIDALIKSINDIRKCPNCNVYYFPDKEITYQSNPMGTRFVWLKCPKCNRRCPSTYGERIKSDLHPFLD